MGSSSVHQVLSFKKNDSQPAGEPALKGSEFFLDNTLKNPPDRDKVTGFQIIPEFFALSNLVKESLSIMKGSG